MLQNDHKKEFGRGNAEFLKEGKKGKCWGEGKNTRKRYKEENKNVIK